MSHTQVVCICGKVLLQCRCPGPHDNVVSPQPCRCPATSPNAPEPAPKPAAGPAIWDLVVADMKERDAMGERKYGRRLRAGDGRDSLTDLYQELLDAAVYIRKAIEERKKETTR